MQSLIMKRLVLYYILLLLVFNNLTAQNNGQLTGTVTDEYNHPLLGATVILNNGRYGATTNRKGVFVFNNLPPEKYVIHVSFLGYMSYEDTVITQTTNHLTIKLWSTAKILDEVVINESSRTNMKKEYSMPVEIVSKAFLTENMAGSLMQTLSRLPGVSSMDIGAGQSKPVIRGLGFNRVVVAENGVKHEAQEWGADHGLEIDQFTVERVEVVKGPASLMYGANAIGGVIDLKQISTPARDSRGGSVLLNTQTNNNLYGISAKYFTRNNHFYFKSHFSLSQYADYKVPTDSIEYMSYYFRLKNNRLRNTAGNEKSAGITLGYLNDSFSSHLSFSDVFSETGFFANAHGLEIRNSAIDYDRSTRDINHPSQRVNHFKILSNSIWFIQDYQLNIDFGFQNNYRQEFSEAVSHGYMPVPPDSLERLYNKNTWTCNLRFEFPKHGIHRFTTGINSEYQENRIGGWGFILPAYQSLTGGIFAYDNFRFSEKWMLNAGIRYDIGTLNTEAYYDWYATPQDNETSLYTQRSTPLKRTFNSLSWGIGATYFSDVFSAKMNVGKSFRMPTAKELASNGITYHMYRYEKGDTALHAEQSYQLDLELSWNLNKLSIELSPFVNYFPNYIYLNPTSGYHEAQQVYYHSESEVFRTGGECSVTYKFSKQLTGVIDAEYVYSVQLSGAKKGFTLPFSPPLAVISGLKYTPEGKGFFKNPNFGVDIKLVAAQNNIVPPEKKTPGYGLINLIAGTEIKAGKHSFQLNAQVHNLLNNRYYDHTSFYRLIAVPGQGRNIVINLQVPL